MTLLFDSLINNLIYSLSYYPIFLYKHVISWDLLKIDW